MSATIDMVKLMKKIIVLIFTFLIGVSLSFVIGYSILGKNDYPSYKKNIKISYSAKSIDKYIDCYEGKISENDFSAEMKNKLNEIYDYFNDNNYKLSFAYEDLNTGLHISFNENQKYFCASTIKAPVALYIYLKAEEGSIDLDSYMTYTPNFYLEGSGSIQKQSFGGQYQIRDLVKRAIVESDNIAYQMIATIPNYDEIKGYYKNKGADTFWNSNFWGDNTAHDGIVYMKEIYKYSLNNTKLSNELMDYYNNSVQKLIKSNNDSKVIHKSGWHYEFMHDTGIVYDKHPYALAIMTNKGNSNYNTFFKKASILIEEFHQLYWQKKGSLCLNK